MKKPLKQWLNSMYGKHSPSKYFNLSDEEIEQMKLFPYNGYTDDNPAPKKEEPEEWIWVEGYKGTDKDMCCRGTQFELGKRYDMPEDAEISVCSSGYHLCLNLSDVFGYYNIEKANRFFKVRALVRKSEYEAYNSECSDGYTMWQWAMWSIQSRDKLASKSIEFIKECTMDEIFADCGYDEVKDWTDERKKQALVDGIAKVKKEIEEYERAIELIDLGYSVTFSKYIAKDEDKFEKACAVAAQPGVSMDAKILAIFCDSDED